MARQAAKKSFFSGPAIKALNPPLSSLVYTFFAAPLLFTTRFALLREKNLSENNSNLQHAVYPIRLNVDVRIYSEFPSNI